VSTTGLAEPLKSIPIFSVLADQKEGSAICPDEWITHYIFDDACGSTIAANFQPLAFGRLL
jgi:hypothetical protein